MPRLARFLSLLSFGLMAPSAASYEIISYKQYAYIGGHPTSSCNYVARRLFENSAKHVEFVFVRGCSRDNRFKEHQLLDVRVLAGGNVLYIPKQSIFGRGSFPWCVLV